VKHANTKQWEFLKIEENKIKREKRACPRCGSGIYMAEHNDRYYCGNCKFTEWKKKS